ncbi:serine threonine protein kinase, CMGC group [Coniochaeta sp. 2T2.1]|nr:serine threonine protein kinase, CMGC group [Coniochaeta sp. 2T2.1]
MASFLRRLPWPGRAWKPLTFSSANFKRIPVDEKVEEEMFPDYKASRYYPVRIGEVLRDRYQIVGKLGFGTTSTVWLARDLNGRRHVALKLFITSQAMGQQLDNELTMYKHISSFSTAHPGRGAIRDLLDSFDVTGPDGSHRCLVHPPLWESIITFLDRNPARRLPAPVLAIVLRRLFQALDFLHTECKIIHTDIKGDNIMFGIEDDSVFTDFEEQEQLDPSPRKILDDRTIYLSRELQQPKKHTEDVQLDVYRAPEVILEAPWSYQIDIWNAGCMVWDLFEGGHLFTGHDPEHRKYRSRAHLSEIIALLGQPPKALLDLGKSSQKFFTDEGQFRAEIPLPDSISLGQIETSLEGQSRQDFLAMMQNMLQWEASNRASAKLLAADPWVREQLGL